VWKGIFVRPPEVKPQIVSHEENFSPKGFLNPLWFQIKPLGIKISFFPYPLGQQRAPLKRFSQAPLFAGEIIYSGFYGALGQLFKAHDFLIKGPPFFGAGAFMSTRGSQGI